MMKIPPAGRLVAPVTGRPRQSTGPPTVAAAPLRMEPKNGSTGVSRLQAAMKSGAKKWRSDWAGPDGTVKTPVVSLTCAPASWTKAGAAATADPAPDPGTTSAEGPGLTTAEAAGGGGGPGFPGAPGPGVPAPADS